MKSAAVFIGLIWSAFSFGQYDHQENSEFELEASASKEWFFACDSGDEIVLRCTVKNGGGFDKMEFGRYNESALLTVSSSSKHSEKLDIREQGIYVLRVHNTDQKNQIKLSVRQKGASDFPRANAISWVTVYDTLWSRPAKYMVDTTLYVAKTVHQSQHFFLNSASNLMGRTRVTLPIELLQNTVRWFYTYTCFRDAEQAQKISKTFDLAGQLAGWLIGSGGKLIGQAASVLTAPPGGDQCDVYLLDDKQMRAFRDKEDFTYKISGTRENYASGVVEIADEKRDLYLGFRNSSVLHGIHISVEVAAIVEETQRIEKVKQSYSLRTRTEPVLTMDLERK